MNLNFVWLALGEALSHTTAAYALATIGLVVHFGFTGLLNFGQAGFMAVGGYAFAITTLKLDWPAPFAFLATIVAATLFALILGIPTLRLRADYLAIVTIAAAEIIRLSVKTAELTEITGGATGLNGAGRVFNELNPIPEGRYGFGVLTYTADQLWLRVFGWALVLLACLIVYLLIRSPWGRVIKGIREDEDAVRSLGKNVFSYKMQSLVLGGVVGCLGGFIYGLAYASIQPDVFGTETTFYAYTMVILGGAARVLGPVVGSAIFWVLLVLIYNTLTEAVGAGIITFMDTNQVGAVRWILVGLGLILLLIFRPQGIFGDKREIAIDAR